MRLKIITISVYPSLPQFKWYDPEVNILFPVCIIAALSFRYCFDHRNLILPILCYINRCRNQRFHREMYKTRFKEEEEGLVYVSLYFWSPSQYLEIDWSFFCTIQNYITVVVSILVKSNTLTNAKTSIYGTKLQRIFCEECIEVYNLKKNRTRNNQTLLTFILSSNSKNKSEVCCTN